MVEKPRSKPGKPASPTDATGGAPGQFGVDDRGNMTWQWREDENLLAEDAIGRYQRVHALVNPSMKVVDGDEDRVRPRTPKVKALDTGYNPYDSGPLARRNSRKKKDLRKFSEWVALRNRLEGKGRKK